MRLAHIIPAAGSGSRFGGPLPKQFCALAGRPLVMTTIERLRQASPEGTLIVLVLSTYFIDEWIDLCAEHGFCSPAIVEGGDMRWQSVKNALSAIPPSVDIISVHDGARPVVSPRLVTDAIDAIEAGADGAIPMIEVTDSLRLLEADGGTRAVDRSRLRAVQTPQMFRAERLRKAYELPYSPQFTDDASVMEAAGFTALAPIPGDPLNLKVTYPGDIERAAIYLNPNFGSQT